MSAVKKPTKIPLSLRLKAWWEGYDPADLAKRMGNKPAAPARAPEPEEETSAPVLTPLQGEAVGRPEHNLPIDPWDENRIDVAQLIWGRGFCGPGGPEHVIAMSKLLTLSPEMSMMHLGAGLGGPARTLAEHFGVWVTGYETSMSLVAAGNEMSTMAGMAKKAPLAYLELDTNKPFERKFDRVLVDNFLSLVTDKAELMERIQPSLKPDNLILITDYFLTSERSLAHSAFHEWHSSEPRRLNLVTVEELRETLTSQGYNIRVDDDLSLEYVSLVEQTWTGADKIVAELYAQPGQQHLVNIVFKEAELWSRRARLLRGGQLSYRRLLASRRDV